MPNQRTDVAIFISSMEGGGAERVMRDLANGFVERGIRTDLLLTRGEGPYLFDLDSRVRVVNFNTRKPIYALAPLVRYLNNEQPTALLSALDHTNLIAVAARHLSRATLRHVVSQRRDPSRRPRMYHEPLEILNHWLLGFLYQRADAVTAVSKGVATSLERVHSVPRDRIRVIYNGFEIPTVTTNDVPHPWFKQPGPPVLLAAGRLSHVKGFDTLLNAFRILLNERPARLIILGEGEEESRLKGLADELGIKGETHFAGFVPDPWTWMRHANVFVLSSRSEGFPGVLLQAMACGVPVVSTNCRSGPDEILEDGRWGRLVPVDDARKLAKAVLDTLDDEDPPPVIKRARDFDPAITVQQYLDLLGVSEEGPQWPTRADRHQREQPD